MAKNVYHSLGDIALVEAIIIAITFEFLHRGRGDTNYKMMYMYVPL